MKTHNSLVVFLRMVPMLLCMGTIFFLSHQPADQFAVLLFAGQDKLVHLLLYALLSWTVIFSFAPGARQNRRVLVFVTALSVPSLFGFSDEYHQSFISGRTPEFLDWAADAAGALLVSSVWLLRGKNPDPAAGDW